LNDRDRQLFPIIFRDISHKPPNVFLCISHTICYLYSIFVSAVFRLYWFYETLVGHLGVPVLSVKHLVRFVQSNHYSIRPIVIATLRCRQSIFILPRTTKSFIFPLNMFCVENYISENISDMFVTFWQHILRENWGYLTEMNIRCASPISGSLEKKRKKMFPQKMCMLIIVECVRAKSIVLEEWTH